MAKQWQLRAIFLVAVALLLLHAAYYYPFLSDDALISLRYADRLLGGQGLSWTEGRPVEGYSNLLWLLLAAGLGRLGLDLILAVRLLGLLGMAVVMLALLRWYFYQRKGAADYRPVAGGLFFFVAAAPTAVWAIGGLEQPLLAALLALTIPILIPVIESEAPPSARLLWLSLLLGLITITRLDGLLFVAAAVLAALAARRSRGREPLSWRQLAVICLFPILLYGGQFLFRLIYYGALVPNTALVKLSPSYVHFKGGLRYLLVGLTLLAPFSFLAILSMIWLLWTPRRRSLGLVLAIPAALWSAYIVFIGGDIFPAHRHFMPLLVLFAYAFIEGVAQLSERDWKARWSLVDRATLRLAALAGLTLFALFQFMGLNNVYALTERWEWDAQVIGLLLQEAFAEEQPLVAVTVAGSIPYWSKLPALDMYGLNDYYLPRHRPADFGQRTIGHELGSGAYVLSREPDIVIFQVGSRRAASPSGRELLATEAFHEQYVPVEVTGHAPHSYTATLWFRLDSDKVGIQHTARRIVVPGHLLQRDDITVSPDTEGDLGALIPAGGEVSFEIAGGTAASWSYHLTGTNTTMAIVALAQFEEMLRVTIQATGDVPVTIKALSLTRP